MSTTRKDKKEYGQINPVKSPINKLTVSDNQGYFADYSTNERWLQQNEIILRHYADDDLAVAQTRYSMEKT